VPERQPLLEEGVLRRKLEWLQGQAEHSGAPEHPLLNLPALRLSAFQFDFKILLLQLEF
jgi:hypothetical protein